jgi:DNA-binding transcriptional LysR family regulator
MACIMARTDLNDIAAFLAIAREGSFTRAAARLSVSPSALSQTVRNLEARLGLRLLTRTTRRIAPTEAGERIIQAVGPKLVSLCSTRRRWPSKPRSPGPVWHLCRKIVYVRLSTKAA